MIRRFKKRQEKRTFYRTNDRIFATTIRVLDSLGKQIGILSRFEALKLARDQGLDLVEIAQFATPPVAKVIDFKKFLYQEAKKKKDEKKKSKVSETKEIRLGPFMDDHDLQVMIRRAREFLRDNDKIRLVVKFQGRQIAHPEFGQKIVRNVIDSLSDISKTERDPHFEGKQLITILSPDKSGGRRPSDKKDYEEKDQKISQQKV